MIIIIIIIMGYILTPNKTAKPSECLKCNVAFHYLEPNAGTLVVKHSEELFNIYYIDDAMLHSTIWNQILEH